MNCICTVQLCAVCTVCTCTGLIKEGELYREFRCLAAGRRSAPLCGRSRSPRRSHRCVSPAAIVISRMYRVQTHTHTCTLSLFSHSLLKHHTHTHNTRIYIYIYTNTHTYLWELVVEEFVRQSL